MRAIPAVALLATVMAAPGLYAQSTYVRDSTAIATAARAFSAAYLRNDTIALANAYADSAIAFPPGRREVVGPAAIGHLFVWPEGYRQLVHVLTIEHLQIQGTWRWTSGPGTAPGSAKARTR